MQELIERLKSKGGGMEIYLNANTEIINEALEKEKVQIVEAFEQGLEFGFPTNGSNYFNKTYNQNK